MKNLISRFGGRVINRIIQFLLLLPNKFLERRFLQLLWNKNLVQVEQEFSAGGNILDPRRSTMSPQSLEMQACVDDWTKAKYRQQELQPEIVNDFFEGDQTTGTEGSE